MTYLETFLFLQILDFLTTLIGMRIGGGEMSPFIAWLMRMTDPVAGLTLVKLLGCGLAGLCLYLKRPRVIHLVNYLFAAFVLWNVFQILKAVGVAG